MRTFLITVLIVIGSLLFLREIAHLPDGKLHLYVLDVSQGDSILIVTPSGKQVLIDGGPNLSVLEHLNALLPFFDRTIDLVVLTHGDSDHITALPTVLDRYTVGSVLMTNDPGTSGRYAALIDAIERHHIPVILPDPAIDIDLGDGTVLDIIAPDDDWDASKNNRSVVVRVLYNKHSILLTGDIEEKAERQILASGYDIRSDVIKVPHHGSHTSSSTGFLLSVDPRTAIISLGRDNRYGHPHTEILERYRHLGIRTITTAENGVVAIAFE